MLLTILIGEEEPVLVLKTKVHAVHVGLSQPPVLLKLIGQSRREVPQVFLNNNLLIVQKLVTDVTVDGHIKLLLMLTPTVSPLSPLIHIKELTKLVKLTQVLTKFPPELKKSLLLLLVSKVLLTPLQFQSVLTPPLGNLINQVS